MQLLLAMRYHGWYPFSRTVLEQTHHDVGLAISHQSLRININYLGGWKRKTKIGKLFHELPTTVGLRTTTQQTHQWFPFLAVMRKQVFFHLSCNWHKQIHRCCRSLRNMKFDPGQWNQRTHTQRQRRRQRQKNFFIANQNKGHSNFLCHKHKSDGKAAAHDLSMNEVHKLMSSCYSFLSLLSSSLFIIVAVFLLWIKLLNELFVVLISM